MGIGRTQDFQQSTTTPSQSNMKNLRRKFVRVFNQFVSATKHRHNNTDEVSTWNEKKVFLSLAKTGASIFKNLSYNVSIVHIEGGECKFRSVGYRLKRKRSATFKKENVANMSKR